MSEPVKVSKKARDIGREITELRLSILENCDITWDQIDDKLRQLEIRIYNILDGKARK